MSPLNAGSLTVFSKALLELYSPQGGSYSERMLATFRALFPTDINSYNEFGPDRALILLDPEPLPDALFETFQAHRDEHANLRHLMEVSNESAVRFSDFYTQAEWRRTGLYNEFFAPLRLTCQMAGGFTMGEGTIIAYALNRQRHDFTEEERTLLNLLRPHLIQAWQQSEAWVRAQRTLGGVAALHCSEAGHILFSTPQADALLARYFSARPLGRLPEPVQRWLRQGMDRRQSQSVCAVEPFIVERPAGRLIVRLGPAALGEHELTLEEKRVAKDPAALRALGLTPREAQVLFWVAQGKTTPEIATILESAARTVTKHLEHIYAKLGVETRTAAAAMALELIG
jgi:DNA-binding CsgD family transcriptional regulator